MYMSFRKPPMEKPSLISFSECEGKSVIVTLNQSFNSTLFYESDITVMRLTGPSNSTKTTTKTFYSSNINGLMEIQQFKNHSKNLLIIHEHLGQLD